LHQRKQLFHSFDQPLNLPAAAIEPEEFACRIPRGQGTQQNDPARQTQGAFPQPTTLAVRILLEPSLRLLSLIWWQP
jgi:hypothetical protein